MLWQWIKDGALNSDCPQANCDTTGTIGFAAQVKPIIDNYCVSCHNAAVLSGGVNLNGYDQVNTYSVTLRNQIPIIVGTMRQLQGFKPMPPATKLDECTIRKIEIWIQQGVQNN